MFGKFILLSLMSLPLLASCAEPKYLMQENNDKGSSQSFSQEALDCTTQFIESEYCLWWEWENKPTATQSGSLIFKVLRPNLYDQSAVYVDIKRELSVVLWMPSMGHGSSPTTVEKLDVGTYRASHVFFVMPGDWDIKFEIKDGEAIIDEATISLIIN